MLIAEKRQRTNNKGSKTDGRQDGDCYSDLKWRWCHGSVCWAASSSLFVFASCTLKKKTKQNKTKNGTQACYLNT